jgi:hypothetical protein
LEYGHLDAQFLKQIEDSARQVWNRVQDVPAGDGDNLAWRESEIVQAAILNGVERFFMARCPGGIVCSENALVLVGNALPLAVSISTRNFAFLRLLKF